MKKTMHIRWIAALCAVMMVTALFAGCKASSKNSNDAAGTSAASNSVKATEAATAANKFEKHLKISASVIGAEKAGLQEDGSEAGNYKWLKEKFNFEYEFIPLTWGNYIDQTRLWIASGDTPDLIMLDVAPVRYSEFVNWVKEGLLQPYPDLEAYPEIKKIMDNSTTGKKFIIDGKMYAYPAYMDDSVLDWMPVKGYTLSAYIYRKDWAKAVGLYKEDGIYTLEEWRNLVKTVIEKDPGGNGPGKTIGIITKAWAFSKFNGGGDISPYMYQYAKGPDGKYVWGPMLPETLEAIKLTREMYDEGIIWKDQIIVKDEDLNNYFHAGLAFAIQTGNTSVNGLNTNAIELKKANPDINPEEAIGLAAVKGSNGKVLMYQNAGQWSQTALSPNMSAEKVERWCHILNYLVSEEGYYFRTLGIPGVDWEMKDGKAVDKWPVDENGNKINPYWTQGTTPWHRMASNWDAFALISPAYPKWIQDLVINLRKAIEATDKQLIPMDVELAYFTGEEYGKIGTKEREIYEEVAALMVSKNLEADWNAWVQSKIPEIQPALDELNAKLK